MTIGMAAIALMNVVWLEAAPSAFADISWKFYLCFIIPAYLFAIICWFFYPNTKGLALEEIALLFGDEVQTTYDVSGTENSTVEETHDKESHPTSAGVEKV
jgi:hypothetical protein